MSYPQPAANPDQVGPEQSGEYPTVRKTNSKDVTTVAPPPKTPPPKSGVHHAVPIPKAPLPPTALPRVKSGER